MWGNAVMVIVQITLTDRHATFPSKLYANIHTKHGKTYRTLYYTAVSA